MSVGSAELSLTGNFLTKTHGSESSATTSGYSASSEGDSEFDSEILDGSDEDLDQSSSEDQLGDGNRWSHLRRWVQEQVNQMYSSRYEVQRAEIPRGPSRMRHVLLTLKSCRPDKFREELCVTPLTFDALIAAIETDPIFQNNSNAAQMPVEDQLAITLFRFGHDRNAAGLQGVANWAAVGKGTVGLVSQWVMTAILQPEFMDKSVRFPTMEDNEMAKKWVHSHSCKAWRNGWCLVDGTLVPLAGCPCWFGESYFDRKTRYSLNIQVRLCPQFSELHLSDF